MTSPYLSIDISPRRSQCWLFCEGGNGFELQAYASQKGAANDIATLVESLRELEKQSGQELLTTSGKLIFADESSSEGVERVGVTLSAGKPIRTALVGLSEKFSLEPLRRLVSVFNTEIVLEINLQNEPNISSQLERLTTSDFDLLIIAGGVNGGPERALRVMVNNLRLLVQLRGAERPQIVYAGNQALADYAKLELDMGGDLHIAGNIQPDIGREDLSFAYTAILNAFERIRFKEFPALKKTLDHPKVDLLPSEFSRGRIGHWLEQTQTNGKGVLQIHLEPEFGQLLVTHNGIRSGVFERTTVEQADIDAVGNMLDMAVDRAEVAAYMLNKLSFPAFLPATLEELSIEMAWVCQRIKKMLCRLNALDPAFHYDAQMGLRDNYEPILLSGSGFDRLPSYRHVFITILDSVLPRGITTLVLDDSELLGALGVLAGANSMLATQVVDSDVFTSLATLISVESPLPVGQEVLKLEIDEGEGEVRRHHRIFLPDLKRIEVLPDREIRAYLAPEENSDVGMGLRGLGGWLSTPPSKLGIIVDARGRPPFLPTDPAARKEIRRDWLWELGG